MAKALLLTLALLAGGLLLAEASMYDRTRGFKTYGASDEDVKKFSQDTNPHHILNRHRNKEGLKEHPEVKRFLQWKAKHKSGHPEAAAAFAGEIPHDFIPYLTEAHAATADVASHGATHGAKHAHHHQQEL